MKYTKKEISYLQMYYHKQDKLSILKKLEGHSWVSIKDKSKKLGLSRPNIRTSKLKKLLNNNVTNAYWWGLIMSDGYISNKGDLKIHLQKSDELYLSQLANYLDCNINYFKNMCTLEIMDKINGLFLKEKLNIVLKKTYNPPINFNFLYNKKERLSFLIGFIDGDGSIMFNEKGVFKSIRIVVHENWFEFLKKFCDEIFNDFNLKFTISRNKRNNTCVYLGKKENYIFLKKYIINNSLPIMHRKWKINN